MECLFCKIKKKEIPSRIVYDDEKVMGIVDIYPAVAGHILLFPSHTSSFKEMSSEDVQHLAVVSSRLSLILVTNLKAEGVTAMIQEGTTAGQKSEHTLMHLIPRRKDDSLNFELLDDSFDESALEKSEVLFEDSDFVVMGFPSLAKGHLAVVPKEKFSMVMKMPEPLVGKMYLMAQKFVKEMKYEANVILNTGVDQALPGVSLHIVPRKADDGLNFNWEPKQLGEEELEKLLFDVRGSHQSKVSSIEVEDNDSGVPEYYTQHLERLP
jgi:histidine triad (HIT) family protein